MNGKDQKTILLVEDEAITAMSEKMAMEKYGYDVITALSGEEAVAMVEKTPAIDLVLMDVNLGAGMDGTEAAAIILRQRDIPVVFLSSHMEPEVVAKTEKITSYGYVVKDSSITVLDASIKMAFKLFEAKLKEKEKVLALAHSHELMQYIIGHMRSAIAVHDRDLKYIYVSQRYLDEYKVNEQDVIGKHHYDVFPDLPQKWRDVHQKALAGEISSAEDDPYTREDGSVDWTRWECRPWHEADGSIGGIIIYTEVINKRKQAEAQMAAALKALGESEEKYRFLIENSHDIIYTLSTTGIFTFVSPSWTTLLGHPVNQVVGKPFQQFVHPDDLVACLALLQKVIQTGQRQDGTAAYRVRHADGYWRWHVTNAAPIKNAVGTVVGGEGIARDVSEHMQAEEATKDSFRFQQLLMDAVPSPIFYKDADCVYIGGNKEFEQYIGLSRQQFIGRTVYDISPRDLAERYDQADRELLRNGGAQTYEASVVYADGTRHDVVFNKAVFTDGEGHIAGLIGVILDISERKQAEAQREAALEALRASEERFHSLFDNMAEGVALHELVFENGELVNYRILDVNDRFLKIIRIAREQVIGKLATEAYGTTKPPYFKEYAAVASGKKPLYFETYFASLDKHFAISVAPWQENGFATIFNDISERKQEEAYAEMGREVLQTLNKPGTLRDSIQHILAILKARTGFDAVGMRLRDGDDYPYFVQEGFSRDFLLTENTLLERGGDGGVCRDEEGRISLECTCGLVISGKADLSAPLFTGGGSFWTNDSLPLLELGPDQEPRHNPRNQCIHQGYASVALVPIRMKEEIVGLLQFNDRRKDRFSLAAIEQLENIAAHIGEALMRKRADEEIQRQLEEKEVLLKEVHHRIKNNIASISGLISLRLQTVAHPQAVAVLKDAIGRVDNMRLLYDKLLLTENYENLSVKNYLDNLIDTIVAIFPSPVVIKLEKQIADFHLDAKRLFPLGSIINELLTNIMKYAFINRKTGLIKIFLSKVGRHITLTIYDNGIGLPAGFDIEQSKGFGLMLVKMLSGQLGGSFSMEKHKGTRCKVEFDI